MQGQVIDILAGQIPEFARMPRQAMFDKIMSDPQLGAGCFKIFRTKPELFAALLVGPSGEPVTEDSGMLSCGRTLSMVIAMVVRNMARRYFRSRLNPAPAASASSPSAVTRFLDRIEYRIERLIRRYWRAPPPRPAAPLSPGEALYRALREFLLHDWQVRLFPRYATMPLAVASSVGPQLLGCREPEDIDALLANYRVPASERPAPPPIVPGESDAEDPAAVGESGMAPKALFGRRNDEIRGTWRRG